MNGLTWTHYADGSHSAATESATYRIRRDFGLDKWALTIVPLPEPEQRATFKLRSLRALILIAEDHAKDLLTLPGGSTLVTTGDSQIPNHTERDQK
jgi:hypothetical protein